MQGGTSMERPELGVYIHVPFCERVCPYCDFAVKGVGALHVSEESEYVDLVLDELEQACARHPRQLAGRRLASVYFGGGTPSLLRAESIERILLRLSRVFQGTPGEVTLELNPGSREVERVASFRSAGITRLSVGLQSLHDHTLRRLGRAQTAAEARAGLMRCLDAGFASVSVDLMYGAPGQTEEQLLADIENVSLPEIAHVSAYALTIEPATPFGEALARGRLCLPDEDLPRRMSRRLRAQLRAAGYEHYEISSFARPGFRARHNARYWLCQDVLGLGVSAGSLLGSLRFQASRSLSRWSAGVRSGRPAYESYERLDLWDHRREALALGFRLLDGISRNRYRVRFGAFPEAMFPREVDDLVSLELLQLRGDCWALSERGLLFADEVFARFSGRGAPS